MKPTHIATVALLIMALSVPVASASTGLNTTPEMNETDANETADAVEQVETAVDGATDQTPIPTPPPDSEFADTPTPNQSEPENGERIEQGLILLNSSYESGGGAADVPGDRGTVTLTLRAESTKAVTLIDAGAFSLGGQLPDRTLDPFKGTETFEFGVYRPEDTDFVGVTIVTSDTMYAEPIRVQTSGPDLPEFPTLGALLLGVTLTAVGTVLVDKHQSRKDSKGVTRIEG